MWFTKFCQRIEFWKRCSDLWINEYLAWILVCVTQKSQNGFSETYPEESMIMCFRKRLLFLVFMGTLGKGVSLWVLMCLLVALPRSGLSHWSVIWDTKTCLGSKLFLDQMKSLIDCFISISQFPVVGSVVATYQAIILHSVPWWRARCCWNMWRAGLS